MSIDYIKLLSEGKIMCDKCKKGFLLPLNKKIPIEKVNIFNVIIVENK